ncbi:hypothetical protein CN131_22875 [Sinorhizobium meliloti]|nr:hypothetical protein CN131_22875 [Sinorhizobium meliloti]
MPEGAGAPLLLPELARSSGEEGGQGDKSEGDHPPKWATQNPPRADPRRSCTERAKGERRKDGETDFPLAGERGQSALSPLKQTNEHTRRRRRSKPVRAPLDRLKGQPQEV